MNKVRLILIIFKIEFVKYKTKQTTYHSGIDLTFCTLNLIPCEVELASWEFVLTFCEPDLTMRVN